ncbi:MAG: mechanosensitive ion channel family protein [Gemmataceae bacterium]
MSWETLWLGLFQFLFRMALAAVVVLLAWLVGFLLQRLVHRLTRIQHIDAGLTEFIGKAAKFGMLLLGGVAALGTLGVDVTALVAGLGLVGFALGFALKDIISNALSGVLVLLLRPFRKGDRISVLAFSGVVVDIDLRYTILDANGDTIYIPNANLFTNPVTVHQPPSAVVDQASAEPPSPTSVEEPGG